jgi:hypothetical protein
MRLEGLEASIAAIRGAIEADDERVILTRTAEALGHVYALWSAYEVSGPKQVAWAGDDTEKRNVVGLVFARGEADHQGVHPAVSVGYGEAPYGLGPYGGGWLWRECPARPAYEESRHLYEEQALWEWIYDPLERALAWFRQNPPGGALA